MPIPTSPSSKEIDKTLKKRIKKVIYQRGITQTTRKGSKELSNLTRRIAQEPFESLEAVEQLGEQLGIKIAEATQQRGGDRLYQGAIRQLVLKGEVKSLVMAATATLSPQEEAAIDTTALPTEVEVSGTPEAEISQAEQNSQTSQESDEEEDSELSPTSAFEEDSPEKRQEAEASEDSVSELEEEDETSQ